MLRTSSHHDRRLQRRAGFTLVEMLVAVALVLLMMTMFTAIFSLATESLSTQRAISDNDQKSRMLMTVLREDIKNRTFRYVFPYTAGEDTTKSITSRDKRREGYFYISSNDLASGADDLLQFTASVAAGEDRYTGRARMLYDMAAHPGQERSAALHVDPNQPEFDDGQLVPNGIAESSAAEIAYFIRNGNLYRRTMLIREPKTIGGGTLDPQPKSNLSGNEFFFPTSAAADAQRAFVIIDHPENISMNPIDPANPPNPNRNYYRQPAGQKPPVPSDFATPPSRPWFANEDSNKNPIPIDDFWRHFDFCAVPAFRSSAPFVPFDAEFLSATDLDNSSTATLKKSFGKPINRFGFNPRTGASREHDQFDTTIPVALQPEEHRIARRFIGRFLHAETSSPNFNWPLSPTLTTSTGNGNPMDIMPITATNPGTPLTLDDATGLVSEISGTGDRMSEDLILPNVHEFRIELWDERLGDFVSVGYGTQPVLPSVVPDPIPPGEVVGDYHIRRRVNTQYGPRFGGTLEDSGIGTIFNPDRVFDTWHPNNFGVPGFAVLPADTGVVLANKQPPYVPYRFSPPNQSVSGPSPFQSPFTLAEVETTTGFTNRGYWQPNQSYGSSPAVTDVVFAAYRDGTKRAANSSFEFDEMPEPGFQLAFRCVTPTGTSGGTEPIWPTSPGARVTDGTLEWEVIDNRRPLKAIRVTFRFQNEKNLQIKELPIVLSLQD